ncbi:23S rRNA methyltransferase [Colwellia sp. MT41]|uniref:23S rRNA (uracil(1939)-C(5))-methyltransferase RlmD n=1 Tax=Colwellia marinimaniae TaxID=1513592 RepID=A0ABQ0MU46_9GAMM|nr:MULTISPECIES: 23S rRNA (uracil(1939)-C(5))-methyltransferase RlmD [Colwellia]ALO35710.1 23S rRNA methyltransferase [Colwellia sp. MT41]GAW95896.1 23S rRNA (uracil(1939)-C(5))-methyltransferase RlmD [Colwellia marinimaniae]
MANFFKATVKPQTCNQRLTVSIEKLDINGVGVARWQNKPVFIAGALPNEVVDVKIIEQKSKYARAKLIAIGKQSEHRVEPQCQHFGVCGGCDLQMLDITEQLRFKQDKVSELFSRFFSSQDNVVKVDGKDLPWQAPIKSSPWHYRRKARIGVQFDKKSHATIGFRQKSTNQLAAIKSCPVLVEPLNDIFPLLKKLLAQLTVKSAIGHIEVIQADILEKHLPELRQKDKQVVLVIRQLKPMNATDIELWQSYAQQYGWHVIIDDGNQQVRLAGSKENSSAVFSYTLADKNKIYFASSDFIQINHQVNNAMISQALAWLNILPSDKVLDLFCGLGNFSLALAKYAKLLVGVEGVQVMVDKASHNAQVNGLDNCQFYQADLNSHWLLASWANGQVFDKVLLDPARAGAEQAVSQIAKLQIPSVLYVSCDPATLARDSAILIAHGYKLEKISLIDMFAQTKHVETMVLFTHSI